MKKPLLFIIMLCVAGTLTAGERIGMQLYSFRTAMKESPIKTLEVISSLGIKEVETANYADGRFYGMDPVEFKTVCRNNGMQAVASHIKPFASIDMAQALAWWETCLAAHKEAGIKYVVMASLPIKNIKTIDRVKELCAFINQVGEMCRKQDLILGIHNHKQEFETVDGVVIYDYLVENTTKDVIFELDVYWAMMAGFDPVELIKKYPSKITLLHVKDEKEIGVSGLLDFSAIIAAAKATGHVAYYILEQERYSGEVLPSVKQSLDYLRSNRLLE